MGSKFTDSPWFWLYLFGMSGLILLWISAPTWIARQTRWERRRTARETAAIPLAEPADLAAWDQADPRAEAAARDAAIARWRTLVAMIAVLSTAGAIGGWWRRYQVVVQVGPSIETVESREGSSLGEASPPGASPVPRTRG